MFYTHLINEKKTNNISFKEDINKRKMPIIKNIRSNSVFTNSLRKGKNENNNNIYINIENNIFKNNNNNRNKTELIKYNLNNYNKIINLTNNSHLSSYEEQLETNLIKSFFDSLKLRAIKKEFSENKTHFNFQKKPIITKNNINCNYGSPDELKMFSTSEDLHKKKITMMPKKEYSYNLEDFKINKIPPLKLSSLSEDKNINGKIKKNKTSKIEYPNTKLLIKLKNIIFTGEKLNKDFKKIKYNYTNNKEDEQNKIKISLIKRNKTPDENIFAEEKNENFLKKQKYFNNYIEKMYRFKYKNKLINRFFKKKEHRIAKKNNFILTEKNEEEEEEKIMRQNQKDSMIQVKILNQIKELKNNIKSNVDKDIFKAFNKNL